MSKSTLVWPLPVDFNETKPGIYPGTYIVKAPPADDFNVCIISDGSCPVYLDESRGSLNTLQSSETMAQSLVEDYINACIGVNKLEGCYPGLFWVAGEFTKEEIKKNFKDRLEQSKTSQNRWFLALIRMADDDWAINRSHRAITPLQRIAATQMENVIGKKEWNTALTTDAFKNCKFCTSKIPVGALVCPTCTRAQVSDEELKKLITPVAAG